MHNLVLGVFAALATASCNPDNSANPLDAVAVLALPGGQEMKIEIAHDGDLRGNQEGNDLQLFVIDDVNYFAINSDGGWQVLDIRIAAELMDESVSQQFKDMIANTPVDERPSMQFEAGEEVQIGQWKGIAYRPPGTPAKFPAPFVISSDPELEMLRAAMLKQFQSSMAMNPLPMGDAFDDVLQMLKEGAPLRFAGSELKSFERVDVEDSRFELPAAPLDKEASRELMLKRGMIPETPIGLPTPPTASISPVED